jgi:microsomal dipeptidase-like Zn-dependent dipeptidase
MKSFKYFVLICPLVLFALCQSFAQDLSPQQLWEQSPVIVSHTHLDPANVETSIAELKNAGVTTALLNLTIDDGDWASEVLYRPPNGRAPSGCVPPGYQWLPPDDSDNNWGARFDQRIAILNFLENQGKIKIVKSIADIPGIGGDLETRKRELAAARAGKLAIIISSEGSNQIGGGHQLQNIEEALTTIANYKSQGWLSTALVHQMNNCEDGHRLLSSGGFAFSHAGAFVASMLMHAGILVDRPHLQKYPRDGIVKIANMANRPVMISHDNPARCWTDDEKETLKPILISGNGTGLIGVHSFNQYLPPPGQNCGALSSGPPTLADFAAAIDANKRLIADTLGLAPDQDSAEHLALGLDWFFPLQSSHGSGDGWKTAWAARGMCGTAQGCLMDLVKALMSPPYNYKPTDIQTILGGNMISLLKSAWVGR